MHTKRTLPCIQEADGGGTGPGGASGKNTVAPGNTHPREGRERHTENSENDETEVVLVMSLKTKHKTCEALKQA